MCGNPRTNTLTKSRSKPQTFHGISLRVDQDRCKLSRLNPRLAYNALCCCSGTDIRWMEIWSATQLASGCVYQHVKDRQREGLEFLLGQSWFKRIWILQEVANTKTAVVVCGTMHVSARIFALAPSLLGVNPELHCQAVLDIFPGSSREDSWWSQERDLHTLLLKLAKAKRLSLEISFMLCLECLRMPGIPISCVRITQSPCSKLFARRHHSYSPLTSWAIPYIAYPLDGARVLA